MGSPSSVTLIHDLTMLQPQSAQELLAQNCLCYTFSPRGTGPHMSLCVPTSFGGTFLSTFKEANVNLDSSHHMWYPLFRKVTDPQVMGAGFLLREGERGHSTCEQGHLFPASSTSDFPASASLAHLF